MTANPGDTRLAQIHDWLQERLGKQSYTLTTASADASFRRYFRLQLEDRTAIVMDAPPDREDCRPFVDLDEALAARGLRVPAIEACDLAQGILLLEDFGDCHYLARLNARPDDADVLYGQAIEALCQLQSGTLDYPLPVYQRSLLESEMALFQDWFLERLLGLTLNAGEREILAGCQACLVTTAREQPQVTVHRDYHSRNLMVLPEGGPGILDFQDAIYGPITYDLVSLLRDCYIAWPDERIERWLEGYCQRASKDGLLDRHTDRQTFRRWFDWMGMQRHFKAIGIFARLHVRDGKPAYLADIPRTLNYLIEVSRRYPAFTAMTKLLQQIDRQTKDRIENHTTER